MSCNRRPEFFLFEIVSLLWHGLESDRVRTRRHVRTVVRAQTRRPERGTRELLTNWYFRFLSEGIR